MVSPEYIRDRQEIEIRGVTHLLQHTPDKIEKVSGDVHTIKVL